MRGEFDGRLVEVKVEQWIIDEEYDDSSLVRDRCMKKGDQSKNFIHI